VRPGPLDEVGLDGVDARQSCPTGRQAVPTWNVVEKTTPTSASMNWMMYRPGGAPAHDQRHRTDPSEATGNMPVNLG
jgi:hypothetical protein